MLLWLFVGVLVHEAGHWAAARALGLNTRWVIGRKGFGVMYWVGDGETHRVIPRHRIAVSLAGPGANLLLAFLYAPALLPNILLGLANLIPFLPGSDGSRILKAARGYV